MPVPVHAAEAEAFQNCAYYLIIFVVNFLKKKITAGWEYILLLRLLLEGEMAAVSQRSFPLLFPLLVIIIIGLFKMRMHEEQS